MAKRMTKAEAKGIMILIAIGLPVYAVYHFGEAVGWLPLLICTIIIAGLIFGFIRLNQSKRKALLLEKYDDPEIVDKIIGKYFWEGQTADQLIDSLGNAVDIDQKVLKTKKKEIWKYNHRGGNRYGLRIILDNDIVVGWEQK